MTSPDLSFSSGFAYRRVMTEAHRRTIVVLHGSGADEMQVLPFARQIDPHANIIAPRGRIDQNGERRWFRKLSPTRFDQRSIRAQAKAFSSFLTGLEADGVLDLRRAVVVGYSNGGNLAHSVMLLHPGRIRYAVLLRSMPVLRRLPVTGAVPAHALVVAGSHDETYGPYAPALTQLLSSAGVKTDHAIVDAGHEIGEADLDLVRSWLARTLDR